MQLKGPKGQRAKGLRRRRVKGPNAPGGGGGGGKKRAKGPNAAGGGKKDQRAKRKQGRWPKESCTMSCKIVFLFFFGIFEGPNRSKTKVNRREKTTKYADFFLGRLTAPKLTILGKKHYVYPNFEFSKGQAASGVLRFS